MISAREFPFLQSITKGQLETQVCMNIWTESAANDYMALKGSIDLWDNNLEKDVNLSRRAINL